MAIITVLAGVNGAGKSSIAGAWISTQGGLWFNPDAEARRLRQADPGLGLEASNAAAWKTGRDGLELAIASNREFVFETTLGGSTIPGLLRTAAIQGHQVKAFYVGLTSPELHMKRVAERVRKGGHDIPEWRICQRFDSSRRNIINLVPYLFELVVFDNSAEADPELGQRPSPVRLLHYRQGKVLYVARRLMPVHAWARPILGAVLGRGDPHEGYGKGEPA